MRTQAELDYLHAKARLKLERQMARRARDEERGSRSLKVDLALMAVGLMLLFIGVSIVMNNNPWRMSPAPLQPMPSVTSTTTPTHPDECHQPWNGTPSWCPGATPMPTPNPCGSPFGGKWCDPTPTTTVPPRGDPGECGYPNSDECGYGPTTQTTTEPFPTELLCDTIRPKPPKCPVNSPVPTVPGVPGSRQGQAI
jgi:hypothetical protein